MFVGEIIEQVAKQKLRDRSNLLSGPTDSLWSDAELLAYFNEGHTRFCAQTHCYAPLIEARAVPNVSTLRLPDNLLQVYTITRPDGVELHQTPRPRMGRTGNPDSYFVTMPEGHIVLTPTPVETETYWVLAAMVPTPLTLDDDLMCARHSVPREYEHALGDYIVWKALTDRDVDGKAMGEAQRFEASYFGALNTCRASVIRMVSGVTIPTTAPL